MDDDDVSVHELRQAVEHMHGVPARRRGRRGVQGEIVWQGAVKVFELTGRRPGS